MSYMDTIEDIDFDFEESPIIVVMLMDLPEVEARGRKFGPFKSGQEVELPFWVAEKLLGFGSAKLRDEDRLSLQALSKIHWRETVPNSRQISKLVENFYPTLRRFLNELREAEKADDVRGKDFKKAFELSRDIVNCRISKIVSLAFVPVQASDIVRNMASEEKALYSRLTKLIDEWRRKMVGLGAGE